ncbi:L-2-hydroxyglutarate oxidase [Pontibacter sp. G13]|uniref:L-2-hydroxyglutarate oxidase n=1 Tax=Pontibacter sp. G13 TaxID=3074898 RepID=UPI00288B6C48|nr:L-2-hydroxyglutarate oxidase [Pontibacter sp. G13]WNJ16716.1 L-2-hydroxyglutarate oxidase [Pontibacter sp. G13]
MQTNASLFDFIVVGGGAVGLSVAYKLQLRNPDLKILVLEKEDQLSAHQTGHNSGVIHSGLYYKPGSYKAKNCVSGRRELVKFAQTHNVAHDVCGKVVVATEEIELPFLDKIFSNGLANDTEGIQKITGDQIREIEPYCAGIAGIWVPCTGIIDFPGVVYKLAELLDGMHPESRVLTGQEVTGVEHGEDETTVFTKCATFKTKQVIFCGGLQSDRLAKMDSLKPEAEIVGFRGDYYDLTEDAEHKVKNLIYPVPNPAFPFLGVHFTRMVLGGVECGPNAVFTFKREGYGKTDFDLKDTTDALSFKGTWALFRKHWKFGIDEYRRAFSKKLFHKQVSRLIPSLTMDELKPGRSGVRAMALGQDGEMIEDFRIEYKGNAIHILNAPSPAATACLAIGDEVATIAEKQFGLKVS